MLLVDRAGPVQECPDVVVRSPRAEQRSMLGVRRPRLPLAVEQLVPLGYPWAPAELGAATGEPPVENDGFARTGRERRSRYIPGKYGELGSMRNATECDPVLVAYSRLSR